MPLLLAGKIVTHQGHFLILKTFWRQSPHPRLQCIRYLHVSPRDRDRTRPMHTSSYLLQLLAVTENAQRKRLARPMFKETDWHGRTRCVNPLKSNALVSRGENVEAHLRMKPTKDAKQMLPAPQGQTFEVTDSLLALLPGTLSLLEAYVRFLKRCRKTPFLD
jgi:hypothetical protein